MSRRGLLSALTTLSLLVAGCGKSPDAGNPDEQRYKSVLDELFAMYSGHVKTKQKPPQKASDLTQKDNQTIYPAGVQGLQSGEYVVLFGTDLNASPDAVLAYHKNVPNEGGWVVLANGTVKHMTADEFKAAPKAGK